jgi:hypothetical protein
MSTSKLATSYTVKTILQKFLETQGAVDVAPVHMLKHTLNFKYSLWPAESPLEALRLRYFGIGIGGRYNIDSEGLMGPYSPVTTDMDLYKPIPFRCRPLDEDLSDAERAQYRIRSIQTINNTKYVCYYLKKMEPVDTAVQIFRIDPETNTTVPYELENRHLNPIPRKPDTSGTQESEAPDIVVGIRMVMNVTAEEVYEYIDVAFKGDRRYAVLSEFGIYSGEDRLIPDAPKPTGTGVFSYTESIATFLSYKTCTGGSIMESESSFLRRVVLLGDSTSCMLLDL